MFVRGVVIGLILGALVGLGIVGWRAADTGQRTMGQALTPHG